MGRDYRFGRMVASMRATGRMIWLTEKADSSTQMAMFMKGNGSMIKHTVEAHTFTWMEQNILVIGKRISNMVTE